MIVVWKRKKYYVRITILEVRFENKQQQHRQQQQCFNWKTNGNCVIGFSVSVCVCVCAQLAAQHTTNPHNYGRCLPQNQNDQNHLEIYTGTYRVSIRIGTYNNHFNYGVFIGSTTL